MHPGHSQMRWLVGMCSDHVEMAPPFSLPFSWPDKAVLNPSVWIRAGQNYASSLAAQGDLTQLYRPPLSLVTKTDAALLVRDYLERLLGGPLNCNPLS